jgi:hypothetical protein
LVQSPRTGNRSHRDDDDAPIKEGPEKKWNGLKTKRIEKAVFAERFTEFRRKESEQQAEFNAGFAMPMPATQPQSRFRLEHILHKEEKKKLEAAGMKFPANVLISMRQPRSPPLVGGRRPQVITIAGIRSRREARRALGATSRRGSTGHLVVGSSSTAEAAAAQNTPMAALLHCVQKCMDGAAGATPLTPAPGSPEQRAAVKGPEASLQSTSWAGYAQPPAASSAAATAALARPGSAEAFAAQQKAEAAKQPTRSAAEWDVQQKAAAEKEQAAKQELARVAAAAERRASQAAAADEKKEAEKAAAEKAAAERIAVEKAAAQKAAAEKAAAQRAAVQKAAAEKAAASMINQGAPWDFFMSHVQRESGPDLALITRDLEKAGKEVWLDKNMKDCSTAAMMEGVEHSKTFVLVLSDGYFDSQFCVKELRRAISLEKKIVLCHKQGVNVGAILQRKPAGPEFASIGDKQSLELVTSDAVYREFAVQRLIASAADGVAPNFGFPFWW